MLNKITNVGKFQIIYQNTEKKQVFLPTFHFLVYKEKGPKNENGFQAICLEFGTFFWHKIEKKSVETLISLSIKFFDKVTNHGKHLKKLDKIMASSDSDEYWGLYRRYSLKKASEGKVSNDVKQNLIINTLMKEHTRLHKENENLKRKLKISERDIKYVFSVASVGNDIHHEDEYLTIGTR